MDEDVSQDIKEIGGNNRCTEISKRHNEDSGRNQHNDYGNGGHYSKGQHQQPGHKCDKYNRSV